MVNAEMDLRLAPALGTPQGGWSLMQTDVEIGYAQPRKGRCEDRPLSGWAQ